MNKRGQVFIIAAVVLAVALISLGSVFISSRTPSTKDAAVYDLSNEIKAESNQVIDNGIFTSRSTTDTLKFIQNLSDQYSLANPGADIAIVYGTKDAAYFYNSTYNYNSNSLYLGAPGPGNRYVDPIPNTNTGSIPIVNGNVQVTLNENPYTFNLHEGENFYVVIQRTIGEEQIVAQR